MGEIIKEKWRNSFWLKFLTISSVILIAVSFVIPPIGEINSSVLAAVGEIEIFGVLWIIYRAIEKGTGAHLSKGNITVDIDKEGE